MRSSDARQIGSIKIGAILFCFRGNLIIQFVFIMICRAEETIESLFSRNEREGNQNSLP